jgi:hypothetical protein
MQIRQAIVVGVTVPLIMFLAWEAAVLGNTSGLGISHGVDPVSALQVTRFTLSFHIPTWEVAVVLFGGPHGENSGLSDSNVCGDQPFEFRYARCIILEGA